MKEYTYQSKIHSKKRKKRTKYTETFNIQIEKGKLTLIYLYQITFKEYDDTYESYSSSFVLSTPETDLNKILEYIATQTDITDLKLIREVEYVMVKKG